MSDAGNGSRPRRRRRTGSSARRARNPDGAGIPADHAPADHAPVNNAPSSSAPTSSAPAATPTVPTPRPMPAAGGEGSNSRSRGQRSGRIDSARGEVRDRGLRELVGSGPSQVGVSRAMRARDVNRPSEEDLAIAEREVTLVRRNWRPDTDGQGAPSPASTAGTAQSGARKPQTRRPHVPGPES